VLNGGNGCSSHGRQYMVSATAMPKQAATGFGCILVEPPAPLLDGPVGGVALVRPGNGKVIEFVGFSDMFKATDGAAVGHIAFNIGAPPTPLAAQGSLQLRGGPGWYTWLRAERASFGELNAGQWVSASSGNSSVLRLQTVVTPGWSGVMEHLINSFQVKHRIKVEQVSSFDTYEKMEMGRADMVISHYKKDDGLCSARQFVMSGKGEWPRFLYANGGAIIGPTSDPANISGLRDASEAIKRIAATRNAKLRVTNITEAIYTLDILRAAAGMPLGPQAETSDSASFSSFSSSSCTSSRPSWLLCIEPAQGGGAGANMVEAEEAGDYVLWGTIPFLKFQERHPDVKMEIMVWDDQLLHHAMVSIVASKTKFPHANVKAANLFQAHLMSAG